MSDKPNSERLVLTAGNGYCELVEHQYKPLQVGYKYNAKVSMDYFLLSSLYCEACGEVIEVVSGRDD